MNVTPRLHVRRYVYDMFFLNTPNEVARTHTRVRFRLRFECTTWVGECPLITFHVEWNSVHPCIRIITLRDRDFLFVEKTQSFLMNNVFCDTTE